MAIMRAKMKVLNVVEGTGCETLAFGAVYKEDGYPSDGTDEDNTFARWTPSAQLSMTITNPELLGKFNIGDKFYLDFTKAE